MRRESRREGNHSMRTLRHWSRQTIVAEEEQVGPKNQEEDCALVTTTAPLHLTQAQIQLFEWAKSDRVDAISELIAERRCNLNVQDNYNRTPLHFAASNGNLSTVKLLVQNHAVVDVNDKYGITPLLWSVYNNHKKVAVYLIENGAKYNKVTKQGHTIVHFIAESNAIGILKYLYHKFHILEIDKKDNSGLTPFMVAAFRGNELLLEVFIRQNCLVTNKDKKQRTALHLASWKGHMAVMNHLLKIPELLALINEFDADEKSALHYAVIENHQEVVRQLLSAGANPNIESRKMDAPLIEVSRRGFHSCIDILLAHGANKDIRTNNGNGAVHAATLANLPDTICFQVMRGFDLHATNNRGQTPLHLAVEQNKLESAEALLLVGAKLNYTDKDGLTPLEVAARASYTTLVDMIIKADRWREQYPDQVEAVQVRLLHIPDQSRSSNPHDVSRNLYSEYNRPYSFNTTNSMGEWVAPGTISEQPTLTPISNITNRQLNSRAEDYSVYHTPMGSICENNGVTTFVQPKASSETTMTSYHSVPPESFVDPFAGLPPDQHSPATPIPTNHSSLGNSYAESELSLGFEASRVWQPRQIQGLGDQADYDVSMSSHVERSLRISHRQSKEEEEYEDRDDRVRISGEERVLPNGEVMVSLYNDRDPRYSTSSNGMIEHFSLLTYDQPYAEEIKVMLFELAQKELKPDDWKHLAMFWGFHVEHITAIEYQDIGKNSYKEHGYRVLTIWLHGVDQSKSPVNELYMALIAIGRKKLAQKLRTRIESAKKKKGCRIQ